MATKPPLRTELEREFSGEFSAAAARRGRYDAWSEFVRIFATEVAWCAGNGVEALMAERRALVESLPEAVASSYRAMFGLMVEILEENPFQDFLGGMYMGLEVADRGHGQFFTPFHISRLMASLDVERARAAIGEKGFVSVYEPSCGAGTSVMALAGEMRAAGLDCQRSLYFHAQDISELTALMCYLQTSLAGLSGHVVVGDTLRDERRLILQTPALVIEPAWTARMMRGDVPCP